MKTVKISPQKAVAIMKKELKTDIKDPLDKVMYEKIWESLKKGREFLLKTGAKLIKYPQGYYISGYSMDGEDVDKYL